MSDPALAHLAPRQLETGPRSELPSPLVHWRLTRDGDGVAWAVLDRKGASVNTLTQEVLGEFGLLLDQVENRLPTALVLRSAKPSGFLAGADIGQFRDVTDEAAIRAKIAEAHALVDRLEALTIPTIAVVHGHVMGGGLELALACRQRIAVEGARFGFPEVRIGLHPGLGGTARFTRQIDPIVAMTYMLDGKSFGPDQARAMGVVDAVVPERHVRAAVRAAAKGEMPRERPGLLDRLKDTAPARHIAAGRMRAEAEKQAPSAHYPAPYALIDLWERHGGDFAAMKTAEIDSFARLMIGDTAQELIRVFFLREKLRELGKGDAGISQVHVIGAGTMGADIAAWIAWSGLAVSLSDVNAEAIGRAIARAATLYEKLGRGDGPRVRDALDRLIPDPRMIGIEKSDLVIEAAPEKIDLKHELYASVEPRMKAGAILATNTSSIVLDELAKGLARPDHFIGLHFFNPVSRLELVEVVRHGALDAEVATRVRAFVRGIDRLSAPAEGRPGFIVNRALTPYLAEAMILLDEGVSRERIDQAARDFGMPMGPLELADQVGLDVALAVATSLKRQLGWPLPDPPAWLKAKVEAGKLGQKTGEGIYVWKDGEPVRDPQPAAREPATFVADRGEDLADRLILPILNQAAALLREGVTDDPDIIDAAMIFGTGFAPFTGGPLHHARKHGIDDVRARLTELAERYGERFRPDAGWDQMV